MTRRKAAAEEREKKLWGQKGFLLKQEDYSFMGDEDKWSMKTARKLAYTRTSWLLGLSKFWLIPKHNLHSHHTTPHHTTPHHTHHHHHSSSSQANLLEEGHQKLHQVLPSLL